MNDVVTEIPRRVLIGTLDSVEDHPKADRLSVNKIYGHTVISNKLEDGSARYKVGQLMIYIPVGAIIPLPLLKEYGYWDDETDEGILGGENNNIVEERKMRGIVSEGLIIPTFLGNAVGIIDGVTELLPAINTGDMFTLVKSGDDVTDFLKIRFKKTGE